MIWSKGKLNIEGGLFIENENPENGGVLYASEDSIFTVTGGTFEDNKSGGGAVAAVGEDATLHVEGGTFSGNIANEAGGVFNVIDGGVIEVHMNVGSFVVVGTKPVLMCFWWATLHAALVSHVRNVIFDVRCPLFPNDGDFSAQVW